MVCSVASYKATHDLDSLRWSALHHAVDCSTFCVRAMYAAKDLVGKTPVDVINTHTTSEVRMPSGSTCLHLACDASDRDFQRNNLVRALLRRRADVDPRDDKGNTPLLVAAGVGVVDIAERLMLAGADKTAENDNGANARNKAAGSSTHMRRTLEHFRCPPPNEDVGSGKTRSTISIARQARLSMRDRSRPSTSPYKDARKTQYDAR